MSNANVVGNPLAPGAKFLGRYQIVRCIRAGGMGAVYEVIHLETKRRRALKVMLPSLVADPDLRARFRLEATITADVETEHIVETFDAGVEPETGAPFLVMELLKGQDLAEILERRGPLPPVEVVTLLSQLAAALDKTHAVGIVHRDLKPENLFVTQRDDGTPRLKVLDFGIAKMVAGHTHAKATARVGTPLYMAPEQLKGDVSIGPRADLYAMGQLAYVMLVGRPYWERESLSPNGIYPLLLKVGEGATDPASVRAREHGVLLDERFDGWFQRAIAVRPSDRFESAGEMVAALADALDVPVVRSARVITPQRPPSDPSRPSGGGSPRPPLERQRSPALAPTELGASASTPTQTGIQTYAGRAGPQRRSPILAIAAGALLALGVATAVWIRSRPADSGSEPAAPETAGVPTVSVSPATTSEEVVPSTLPTAPPTEPAAASASATASAPRAPLATPPGQRRNRPPAAAPTSPPPSDPTKVR